MPADDALIFIDANKYLHLFGIASGKKLLPLLAEQSAHIFVTQQIVDEVQRNKVNVAATFLHTNVKEAKLEIPLPDHLGGANGDTIRQEVSRISKELDGINDKVAALAASIVLQVGRSEDDVSKALEPIFRTAAQPNDGELERARRRRECGNPPGTMSDPMGDQLNWEQLLTAFAGKKRLWIVTADTDYFTEYRKKSLILNARLLSDLRKISPAVEVFVFKELADGIPHFVDNAGVTAEQKLTPEEVEEIEEEESGVPPLTGDPVPRNFSQRFTIPVAPNDMVAGVMREFSRLKRSSEATDFASRKFEELTAVQEEQSAAIAQVAAIQQQVKGAYDILETAQAAIAAAQETEAMLEYVKQAQAAIADIEKAQNQALRIIAMLVPAIVQKVQ